jgi:NAD(P)-dependent dehydrogenase (short-subunit alcohol dehydrogenase family)
MAGPFAARDILVTGGSTGIGLATAKGFAEKGARVFITGQRQKELEVAKREIGHDAIAIQADAGKLADLDCLFSDIKQIAGKLDLVFANADGGCSLPLAAVTEDQFDATFERNVKGVLFTVQKSLARAARPTSGSGGRCTVPRVASGNIRRRRRTLCGWGDRTSLTVSAERLQYRNSDPRPSDVTHLPPSGPPAPVSRSEELGCFNVHGRGGFPMIEQFNVLAPPSPLPSFMAGQSSD